MVRSAHPISLMLVVGAALTAAPAAAQDNPACAKIENALAYNACLAKQGPPAHGTRAIAPPADADAPRGAHAFSGPSPRSSAHVSHARNGRMVLEFSIGGAPVGSRKHRETR